MTTTVKLTKRIIDAAAPRDKNFIQWDSDVKGFGLRVYPTGRKVFLYKYREVGAGRNGATKWVTIGQHGNITAEEARGIAKELSAEVAQGHDPAKERQAKKTQPTFKELADLYLERHATPYKKPKSIEEDKRILRLYVLPAFTKHKAIEVNRKHVVSLHQKMADKPTAANRTLALLSMIFNVAEQWGLRPQHTNPCLGVKRFKEQKRGRLLSDAELTKLGQVLRYAENTRTEHSSAINAIRLILFTGCRRSEAAALTWDEVDFDQQALMLKDKKTGDRGVLLSAPALLLLQSVPRQPDNPYVFYGRKNGSHIDLGKPWERLRKAAALETVRLQDLRHNVGSRGAISVGNAMIVKELLGHTQLSTTERYMHLSNDPIRKATDKIGAEIANALAG